MSKENTTHIYYTYNMNLFVLIRKWEFRGY